MTVALKKNMVVLLDERSGSNFVHYWFYLKILFMDESGAARQQKDF